jgi:hypothetical protein
MDNPQQPTGITESIYDIRGEKRIEEIRSMRTCSQCTNRNQCEHNFGKNELTETKKTRRIRTNVNDKPYHKSVSEDRTSACHKAPPKALERRRLNCAFLSTDFRFNTDKVARTDEGGTELGHDNALGDEAYSHHGD